MSPLAVCSTAAIVIGLCGALPQLAAMVRARSSAGQSSLAWALAAFVNVLMIYVNVVGYHATVLAVGNITSIAICAVAVALVLHFRAPSQPEEAGQGAAVPVAELATTEFWALRELLEDEARRRDGERSVLTAA